MRDAVAIRLVSVPPQWPRVAAFHCFYYFYTALGACTRYCARAGNGRHTASHAGGVGASFSAIGVYLPSSRAAR